MLNNCMLMITEENMVQSYKEVNEGNNIQLREYFF